MAGEGGEGAASAGEPAGGPAQEAGGAASEDREETLPPGVTPEGEAGEEQGEGGNRDKSSPPCQPELEQ